MKQLNYRIYILLYLYYRDTVLSKQGKMFINWCDTLLLSILKYRESFNLYTTSRREWLLLAEKKKREQIIRAIWSTVKKSLIAN